ncbi:MAG: response regulator [Solirubrobacteraceae bacterium]|nr:response regulator [Solirubrobacteraceae bacterium]
MGLAVARGLADAMNGTLTVESTVGEGTTFSLILPETSAPRTVSPPQQHAEPAAPAGAAASARLLYIEDNPSNLRLVERILERRPAWVMTHADRAAPGLKLALATRFDLILLDQHLPDGEGVSILEPLRARDDRVDVPVVMVTADASPGQRERAASAGANGYLVKPFTIRELLSVLDAWAPDPACPRKESNLQPSD